MRKILFLAAAYLCTALSTATQAGPAEDKALLEAARDNVLSAVSSALQNGADVNAADPDMIGATALMYAVAGQNMDMAMLLIEEGADIDQKDSNGDPAINWAAYYGYQDFVLLFIQHRAETELEGHGSPLEIAMRRGFQNIVSMLAHHERSFALSPDTAFLIDAISNKDLDGVAEAMTLRIDPNSLDFSRRPVLGLAARVGDPAIIKTLLENGANVDGRGPIGYTPLMEAARDGQLEAAKALLAAGADPNAKGKPNGLSLSVIHMAALSGNPDMVKLIAEHGANLNAQGRDGGTAMAWAFGERKNHIVKLLLELGADPTVPNKFGINLADHIRENGPDDLKALLP